MDKEKCKVCPFPEIVSRIIMAKNATRAANANILSSGTPTEAKPYQIEAGIELAKLKIASNDLDLFLRADRKCEDCKK